MKTLIFCVVAFICGYGAAIVRRYFQRRKRLRLMLPFYHNVIERNPEVMEAYYQYEREKRRLKVRP